MLAIFKNCSAFGYSDRLPEVTHQSSLGLSCIRVQVNVNSHTRYNPGVISRFHAVKILAATPHVCQATNRPRVFVPHEWAPSVVITGAKLLVEVIQGSALQLHEVLVDVVRGTCCLIPSPIATSISISHLRTFSIHLSERSIQ